MRTTSFAILILIIIAGLAYAELPAAEWAMRGRGCTWEFVEGVGMQGRKCYETQGRLFIATDGSYRWPGGTCTTTGEPIVDEIGTIEPGPHRSYRFRTSNIVEGESSLLTCLRARLSNLRSFHFAAYRDVGHVRSHGTRLIVRHYEVAVLDVNGHSVRDTTRVVLKGVPVVASAGGAFTSE